MKPHWLTPLLFLSLGVRDDAAPRRGAGLVGSDLGLCMAPVIATKLAPASSGNRLLGRVCVEETGKPAPGVLVTVTIKGREVRTGSDSTGWYVLTGIPLGEFTVRVRGIGYYPEQRQIEFGGCGWRLVDSA